MLADGKLFIPTASGTVFVLATGQEAKLLGKVNLAEECHATPCVAGTALLLCGNKHLWAVEDKGAVAPAP